MNTVLEVDGLKAYYPTDEGVVRAVDGVSLKLERGLSLGLAGESGCGKSTLGYSIIRLLPPPGRMFGGRVWVDGVEVTSLGEDEMRRVRWERVSMVFQGAMNTLNPVYKIGRQMVETVLAHRPELGREAALELAARSLEMVRLPAETMHRYPHELSGGMKQRVVIAMALMLGPKLLIADEPTTALDVVVQAQVLNVLKRLQRELGLSVLLITHDLSVIPELSDVVAVMYAGRVVELAPLEKIYREPRHPYTHLLLESVPRLKGDRRLRYIPGEPPDLRMPPPGCRFHPRCPYSLERCRVSEPPRLSVEGGGWASCWLLTPSSSPEV